MKATATWSLLALLFVAAFAAPAAAADSAAPAYVSSEPSDGEMVQQAPAQVDVVFSELLEATSKMTVTDECGKRVDDDMLVIRANVMSIGIARTPSGKYKVSYLAKGLGGLTGETKGSFDFMVHKGPACDPAAGGGHANMPGMGAGSEGDGAGNGSGSPHSSMQGGPAMDSPMMSGMGMPPAAMTGAPMAMGSMGGAPMKASSPMGGMDMAGGGGSGSGRHASMDSMDDEQEPTLAAGPGGLPVPDGQAVTLALSMSLMVGAVGGWFLRVSGAP